MEGFSDAPSLREPSSPSLDELQARVAALASAAPRVPLGHECRSCGASSYNRLSKISRYLATGELCCANMRVWLDPTTPIAMTAAEKRAALQGNRKDGSSPQISTEQADV